MSSQTSSMETTLQSPSNESFSYSWIPNLKLDDSLISSVDAFDHQDEASFIEMDPRLPPSKRFFRVSSDFCFEFPSSDHNQSPLGLVHADQLISNGFLVPLFVEDVKTNRFDCEDDYMSNCSSSRGKVVHLSKRVRRVSWKRFFEKYLKFLLRPFFCRRANRNWEFSAGTLSPRTSVAYSCDSESSIYEAVLHCKRTQGKY
ncbi:hypothetical protein BUALT_Bualt06G0099100 [Buddleja alternifolia]|uniref:Membrane-associated kinase regulator 6 n=1 Tax=Buddleja alternifolia TaxID=168488 RepID=A0AAV6XE70_9LAMI|nr:hypothetical protein BUALT_Bualt06G0099100 [Buddleja alternifolia]